MPDTLAPPRQRALAQADHDVRAIFDGYGFPQIGQLQHLCAKRVMGQDASWTSFDVFTSSGPPAQMVAAYQKRLTKRGLVEEKGTTRWELPPGAPAPRRSLSISAPSAPGRHMSCDQAAPSGTKSVLTVSKYE